MLQEIERLTAERDRQYAENVNQIHERTKLEREVERLTQWIHDLQSDMYINCVYCGYRYGPNGQVPVTMAQVLKDHVEKCEKHQMHEMHALKNEVERMRNIGMKISHEVEQSLGKALGYPWFKDDQKNFPGATDLDGVCVADHVAETIAEEAANRIRVLELHFTSLMSATEAYLKAPYWNRDVRGLRDIYIMSQYLIRKRTLVVENNENKHQTWAERDQ